MDPVSRYFRDLTPAQLDRFSRLGSLYRSWNDKINVISRKDIDHLYIHHVLHSLAIARFVSFKPGTRVLDAGTGGGFPGIPLAILFPETRFTLADSIAKKLKVVEAVAGETGLENVETRWGRVEQLGPDYDFVISRAVTAFPEFVSWTRRLIRKENRNAIPNGILYLKGGDLETELGPFAKEVVIQPVSDYFTEEYFETKKIIYLPVY